MSKCVNISWWMNFEWMSEWITRNSFIIIYSFATNITIACWGVLLKRNFHTIITFFVEWSLYLWRTSFIPNWNWTTKRTKTKKWTVISRHDASTITIGMWWLGTMLNKGFSLKLRSCDNRFRIGVRNDGWYCLFSFSCDTSSLKRIIWKLVYYLRYYRCFVVHQYSLKLIFWTVTLFPIKMIRFMGK